MENDKIKELLFAISLKCFALCKVLEYKLELLKSNDTVSFDVMLSHYLV